ncbi:zinc finger protein [Penicillium brevicompactum]|nr:transcriptional regulator family: C2H2 zinc finger [Penicillium roqueforti]
MPFEQRELLRPLLPAPDLPEYYADPHLSITKPLTPATTPFYHMDSHALPSWPEPGQSICEDNLMDAAPMIREFWVDHGIVQVYHCAPAFTYHTRMPLGDHVIPSLHHSHEADRPLETASTIGVPLLRLYLASRIDSERVHNIVERIPETNFSTIQTINPALVFPSASTTTHEPFSCRESHVTASEACPIPSGAGISSTRLLDPSKENFEKIDDTTMCISDPSLLDCPVYRKHPGHELDFEDPEYDMYRRAFNCTIIGCRRGFKRQDHLERHIKSHSKEKPHVCWVPGCHRAFARRDNLKAHCTKTHARRGGRNRYVATLDKTSPDYDPGFRGELSLDGHPLKFPALLVPGPEAKFQQP